MELIGLVRNTEAFDQLRARHENIARRQKMLCHHGLVHDRADTKGDIDGVLDKIDAPIGRVDENLDIRIAALKTGQQFPPWHNRRRKGQSQAAL